MKSLQLNQTHNIKLLFLDEENRFIDIKNYAIKYSLFSLPGQGDTENDSKQQNKAFLKINFFILSVLNESLVYTISSTELINKFFADYDNNFIVLPTLQEVLLLEAIHCKLSVIIGDSSFIGDLSMEDLDTHLSYTLSFDNFDYEYALPTRKEWLGDLSFWDDSWWERYDISTFDNIAESAEEKEMWLSEGKHAEYLTKDLESIDEHVDALFKKFEGDTDTSGEVIDLEQIRRSIDKKGNKWKPTIV